MPESTRERCTLAGRFPGRSLLVRLTRRRLRRFVGQFPVLLLAVGFLATLAWTLFLCWAAYRLMSFVLA